MPTLTLSIQDRHFTTKQLIPLALTGKGDFCVILKKWEHLYIFALLCLLYIYEWYYIVIARDKQKGENKMKTTYEALKAMTEDEFRNYYRSYNH